MNRFLLVVAAAVALWSSRSLATAQPSAAAVPCNLAFTSPLVIRISGTLGGLVIDDACQNVYVTNRTRNRVEHVSLQSLTLNPPIQVGSMPVGLDLRPGTNLLYVANTGGNNMSVVDVVQRREVRRIITPTDAYSTDRPHWIAIASNGLALFSTDDVTTTGGKMKQLNLNTDEVVLRSDFGWGNTTEDTRLRASGNRNAIGIAVGSSSRGSIFRYDAATNTFGPERQLDATVQDATMDRTGSVLFVTWPNAVLDAAMNVRGTFPHSGLGSGAVSPDGRFAYRSRASAIDVLNLQNFTRIGGLTVGDSLTPAWPYYIGQMALSADGRLLAVITNTGLSILHTGYNGD